MSDTYLLKVSGKAEAPSRIETGHNYHVALEGSITTETKTDNDDGSHTFTALFKPIKIEVLDQKGEIIKLKDTRSNSVLIRMLLYKKWVNAASAISFDEYYDSFTQYILGHMDDLLSKLDH